ncbi:MAG: GNAT family N-acetyltransferase [Pseudomonadota bacterium]
MTLDIKPTEGVERASPRDARAIADITAQAFAEDPVNRHVFGRPRAILSCMRVLARRIYVPGGHSYSAEGAAAAMWLAPGQSPGLGGFAQASLAAGMFLHASKGAMGRALALSEKMDAHHPEAPHMYLFTIGTRPEARGRGLARSLMAPVLAACDRAGLPVYLENSNPANTGFYKAQGFQTVTKFEVAPGGPVMEPMWREPAAGAG